MRVRGRAALTSSEGRGNVRTGTAGDIWMAGFEPAGELFVRLVTHPLAWRGFGFLGAWLSLLGLSLWRGGWAEQLAAGGSIVQFTTPYALSFLNLYWPGINGTIAHLATDLGFLVLFLPLVVHSRRTWPLWFYAFICLCPLSLAVMLLTPVGDEPFVITAWIWSLCAFAALAVGVAGRILGSPRPQLARDARLVP